MSRQDGSAPPPRTHALVATTRFVVPVALVVCGAGALLAIGSVQRALFLGLCALVASLAVVTRVRRAVLLVDDDGYRVRVAGRETVAVRWAEVRRARAVPAEQAMYVDCGDKAKNLLLPRPSGFGFRFERQRELYRFLEERLAERVAIVDDLAKPDPDHPPAAAGGDDAP